MGLTKREIHFLSKGNGDVYHVYLRLLLHSYDLQCSLCHSYYKLGMYIQHIPIKGYIHMGISKEVKSLSHRAHFDQDDKVSIKSFMGVASN